MPYATIADLEKRLDPQTLAELADDNGDGSADSTVLEAMLADASSEIDLFLGVRYSTPLASPPQVLCRMAADIAAHGLFVRRRSTVSPEYATRYANALKALSEIAAGRLSLPGVSPRRQCECTRSEEEKTFSAQTLSEF